MVMVSMHSSDPDASIHMQHDPIGSPCNLDLKSKFDLDLSWSSHICFGAPSGDNHNGKAKWAKARQGTGKVKMTSKILMEELITQTIIWLKIEFNSF